MDVFLFKVSAVVAGYFILYGMSNNCLKCTRMSTRKRYSHFLTNSIFRKPLNQLVGTTGFEPATPCPKEK